MIEKVKIFFCFEAALAPRLHYTNHVKLNQFVLMKKTKEKQITSYEQLVRICESFGDRYKPSNEAIKPAALSSLLDRAQQSVKAVTVALQAKSSVISDRNETYAGIPKLATRIFHAMTASGAPKQTLEDAMQIRRTFEYTKRKSRENAKPLSEGSTPEAKRTGNPAAQLNFEAKAKNFSRLIECVKTLPSYSPIEEDLKLEMLEAFHQKLVQLTSEVIRKHAAITEARMKRNAMLFGEKGVFETAKVVKHYVRSAFRHNSDEVIHVSSIRFSKR
jgi:hypothetical protein